MQFEEISQLVKGIPFMESERAKILYDFIIENRVTECLELGFAHGVGSCYIAAALDELGTGQLTSVDLLEAKQWQEPSIEALLARTGLENYVTVAREHSSYTWFLKKKIEECTEDGYCSPVYDFCFIDGPKNWTIDGFAFFLVDKLLKQGGWLLFDDLGWKYSRYCSSDTFDGLDLQRMGEDELDTAHIDLVFRLLVMQHPDYSNFKIQDSWWAWAQKVAAPTKKVRYEVTHNLLNKLAARRGKDRE